MSTSKFGLIHPSGPTRYPPKNEISKGLPNQSPRNVVRASRRGRRRRRRRQGGGVGNARPPLPLLPRGYRQPSTTIAPRKCPGKRGTLQRGGSERRRRLLWKEEESAPFARLLCWLLPRQGSWTCPARTVKRRTTSTDVEDDDDDIWQVDHEKGHRGRRLRYCWCCHRRCCRRCRRHRRCCRRRRFPLRAVVSVRQGREGQGGWRTEQPSSSSTSASFRVAAGAVGRSGSNVAAVLGQSSWLSTPFGAAEAVAAQGRR